MLPLYIAFCAAIVAALGVYVLMLLEAWKEYKANRTPVKVCQTCRASYGWTGPGGIVMPCRCPSDGDRSDARSGDSPSSG